MENYIVRIYRRDHSHPDNVVGTIESVEEQCKYAFNNLDRLHSLLVNRPLGEEQHHRTLKEASTIDEHTVISFMHEKHEEGK